MKNAFQAHLAKAEAVYYAAKAEGRKLTPGERETMQGHIDRAEEIKANELVLAGRADELSPSMQVKYREAQAERANDSRLADQIQSSYATKSTGSMFDPGARSEFVKSVMEGQQVRMKATVSLADAGVAGDYRSGVIGSLSEPFRVRSLFGQENTDAPSVWFRRISTASAQADTVAEGALKPEATIVAENVEAPVRKIAVYLPVNEEVVDDGGPSFVQTLVDDLTRDLIRAENGQLLNGSGVAPNLEGILQTTGIQVQAKGTDSNLDALIKAIGKLRATYMEPTDVILNPADFEVIRLAKASGGEYLFDPLAAGQPTLMGAPIRLTTEIAAGTGLVVNGSELATVWNRSAITVEYSDSHADFFQRNIRAIRAEERIAFGVKRPSAAVSVTGLSV